MKHRFYSLLLTGLFGMWGMQVGAQDLTTTEIDGVTYYEIDDAADLVAFVDLVNTGQFGANAILTADIALTEAWDTPIGIGAGNSSYTGIFDGQGHKITGFEAASAVDGGGFFGYTNNATIKNFSIDGVLTSTGGTGSGVVGYPSNSTIFNIHSTLDVIVPSSNVHHVGGVVGSARGGNTISNCTFSGTMNVAAGSTDNFAGVVAYLGGDSVVFCANYGIITFSDVNCAAGGVAGYLNNTGTYVMGCLNMGAVVCDEPEATPKWGGAIIGRLRTHDLNKVKNNVWQEDSATAAGKDNDGNVNLTTAFCANDAQLASGEACFFLNGDQSVIGWYQNLNEDELPILDATHAQVYMVGRLHCNGDAYEGASYTNTNTAVVQDEHDIVNGFCTYCGMFDENFLTPNADGFYEIATAGQLAWFEQKVNRGQFDANAVLTADIDFADLMPEGSDPEETEIEWTPIGDWGATRGVSNAGYKGHFDGQGHTIRNLNATSKQNYFGLFGVISTGCLIENFTIYGNYNTKFQYAGSAAAYARDNFPTIRNVHSYVNIHNSYAGGRQGGILGGVLTTADKTIIENCSYSGTLDGNDAGGSGNYGGIVGYVNNNGATVADITNCLFDGEVVNRNPAPGGCTFGGFVGYSNGGVVTIKNGLSIGTVESAVWGMFFGAVKSTKSSLPNSYYIGEILNGSASTVTLTATETNAEELASGEICWKLNGETFLDVVWHQDLNEENYPKPTSEGAVVYQTTNGYSSISEDDPDSFADFINSVIATETDFIEDEDLVAYRVLVNEYKEAIASWEDIENYDDFIAAYKASFELKEAIKQSAASYAAYVKACEDAATYIEENNLEGTWTDFLKTYLEENVEPNNDYPNGSSEYILDNCSLDDEALAREVAFVNQMLENAIAGGITPGTEITRLMVNSDFTQDYEGWTVETDGGTATVAGVRNIMSIPEGYNNNSFSASQTLVELPNGIYMMSVNGLFRGGSDIYSQFYAGQLYLNGTYNYFMSQGEDVLSADEAEDKVNCDLASDQIYSVDGVDGYVPNGRNGCSYAFNAGRYQNFCATEVTDGNLTVGVRNLGTGLAKDWLPFGGLHVYYLGTAEEASEKLDQVLEGYAMRAQTVIDFSFSENTEDFMQFPNISEELKTQLSEAISSVGTAATGEEKMALIGTFSALFNEVHACRKAYIAMYDAANKLFDFLDALIAVELISEDEYEQWSDLVLDAQGHFINGDVTTEEALALAAKLNLIDEMLPQVDGVYQLSTVGQLKLFALTVNSGQSDVKAVLTNDIDLSEVEDFTPIGSKEQPFTGEFDGQNFKITGFGQYIVEEGEEDGYYTLGFAGDMQGFFGYVKNATIQNFSIDGAFTYNGGTGYGAIGWAEGSTLINIHSSLNIASVSTSHHIGGVCGDMRAGSKAYNCSFSGTITDAHGTHDCIGGIGGYSNENCLYENCANYGTIIFSASNAYAGGICGYVNNDSFVGIFNSLNVGTVMVESGNPTYGGAFVGRLRSHANSKFENNYMLQGSAPNTSGENATPATTVNAEQLASGEVCYKLNGDQEEINWFQTLGEDTWPVLFSSSLRVWFNETEGTYTNVEPGGAKGDLNGDGNVDIADAVSVLKAMAENPNDQKFDVNGDGNVDIADFVSILKIMAE